MTATEDVGIIESSQVEAEVRTSISLFTFLNYETLNALPFPCRALYNNPTAC